MFDERIIEKLMILVDLNEYMLPIDLRQRMILFHESTVGLHTMWVVFPKFSIYTVFPTQKTQLDPKQQTFPPKKTQAIPNLSRSPNLESKEWTSDLVAVVSFKWFVFWWILMVWPLIHHQQCIKIANLFLIPWLFQTIAKKAMGICWWILLGDKISGDAWRYFD